ncbi:MAG: hypothetical protein GAK28_02616 [Luteibacter sp.]|nr:MAG: hypothetical protein GAK28_02616 [Luteibacter sp.]
MALVAVWLTVLAPTVSRTAAFEFPDLGAWCEPVGHHHDDAPAHHDDGDAACGYCTLFSGTPSLGGGTFATGVAYLAPSVVAAGPVPSRAITATSLLIHARGPPVVATA